MALLSVLNTAISGLQTTQSALQITSGNIANAGTEGYTRKSVTQVAQGGRNADLRGVQISSFQRATDNALTLSTRESLADEARLETQSTYYGRLESSFGLKDTVPQISTLFERFASAWQSLQAAPESAVRAREIITTGYDFSIELRRIATQVEQVDRDIRTDTQSRVGELQSALSRIGTLNEQITSAAGNNLPTGDLEDQRDRELDIISALVAIDVSPTDNNGISIRTRSGVTLFDRVPATFNYDDTNIFLTNVNPPVNITSRLSGGRLDALVNLRADSSPAAPSTIAGQETIRKLRDQLNEIAISLTTVTAGPPQSFASAYDSGTAVGNELASGFFTVTAGFESTTFSVNANLLDGTNTIKGASIVSTADAVRVGGRSFSMDGLTSTNVSYSGLISSILSSLGQDANQIDDSLAIETTQRQSLQESLRNRTGVNLDEEILNLQTYQQSYAANARMIAVVNELFQQLEALLR